MSKAFGPKGVRARLIASFQLPAHGPAPPRTNGRCRRLDGRTAPERRSRMGLFVRRLSIRSEAGAASRPPVRTAPLHSGRGR